METKSRRAFRVAKIARVAGTESPPGLERSNFYIPRNAGTGFEMNMLAAVMAGPALMRLEKVPVPEPGPGTIRVRLEGSGVCGSNLPPWEGRPWFNYPFPAGEPGHEGWGVVDQVGDEVDSLKPGDRVALLSYRAFAEFDVAPALSAVRLPPSLAGKPFPGEALGCAMNVFRRSMIQPGQKVAVVGAGFLGNLLIGLAARAGARVMAISRRDFALNLAKEMGAEAFIKFEEGVADAAREWSGGSGFDCVIEATGLQDPLTLAGELTRERGRLIIAGYHQDGTRQVNLQLWNWKGIDVINAHERDPQEYRRGMEEAVTAVETGALNPYPLFTHSYTLPNINQAFICMRDRDSHFMKGLVFA